MLPLTLSIVTSAPRAEIHKLNEGMGVFIGKTIIEAKDEVICYLSVVWYSGIERLCTILNVPRTIIKRSCTNVVHT
jgi:hypothetical protein